jgi:hypothetical protein
MVRTSDRRELLARFEYPFRVEVRAAEFEPLGQISLFDRKKLGSGKHRIEIGSSAGGCCRRRVFALVQRGMVTGLDIESCRERQTKLSKETQGLVKAAYKRSRRKASSKWKPVPVRDFFASPAAARSIVISWGGWCIQVCWTSGTDGVMTCLQCCAWPPNCRIDTIYTGPLS